jgi:hypothetical protein
LFLTVVLTQAFLLVITDKKQINTEEDYRFLSTSGTKIVNMQGEEVVLRGLNAGGLFVLEEWMCPVTDSTELGELDQKKILAKLETRFGYDKSRQLMRAYEDSWWGEEDFDNIKNAGFNSIRLPFTYMNLEDAEGNITKFEKLDWFIDLCDEKDLYVILDLHGAYGSQNGKHHSGDTSGTDLFDNVTNKEKTINLWVTVANRYKDRSIVAGYDLLNEPEGAEGQTGWKQWLFYFELCNAIRQIGDEHILIIESVWETDNLPSPAWFTGQGCIVYSFHEYNWPLYPLPEEEKLDFQMQFVDKKMQNLENANFGIPIYIGEYNFFNHIPSWEYALTEYRKENISWAVWTYKVKEPGSYWGLYTPTANLEQVDIATDSYDEMLQKIAQFKTSNTFTIHPELSAMFREFFSK